MILYRKIILISLILVSCILFKEKLFSYDTNIAHPYLTEKAIEVFNNNSEIQISNEQKNWIVKGAIEEDTPIRWMNHFYNPVYGQGLWNFSSAKNWARKDVEQTIYTLGDQTWQKAISDYAKGDKKSAFVALGHVLHLMEDMSVPAHTRLDAHPEGDPYEQWAKQNAKTDFETEAIVKFSSLENYFDSLAGYSNKYFLSKDSFNLNVLNQLDKTVYFYQDKKYLCLKSEVGQCLILVKQGFNGDEYYFYDLVHSDYFSLLASKTVSHSAGVIDLFFKEAIAAEREFQNKSWFERWKIKVFGSNLNQLAGTGMVADWTEENDVEKTIQGENEEFVILNPNENSFSPDFPNDESSQENIQIAQNESQDTLILPLEALNSNENNELVNNTIPSQNTPFWAGLPYAGFGGGGGSAPVLAEEIVPLDSQQEDDEDTESVEPEIKIKNEDESKDENASSTSPELDITPPESPQIIFPENLSQTFTSLQINFSGITEASSTVFAIGNFASTTNFDFGSTTADGLGNWFLVLDFEEGTTTLEFFAKDLAGNVSSSTQTIIFTDDLSNNIIPPNPVELAASRPVVINEVAWAGTGSQTSSDEWLELYNRSDENISLEGWILYSEDNGPYINLTGIIPSKGYYLIERADDDTISDISADWFGSFGNGLSNSGEKLFLSYASTTIDQTALCGRDWCAGGPNQNYSTMERIDPGVEGTNLGNWARNNFLIVNGKSAIDTGIRGTPKSRNSANTEVAGNLPYISSGEVLLKKSQSPYVVNNTLQVFQGNSIVRIEPGVVVKFYNDAGWKFWQNAKIIAQGTVEEPVVFTSFEDDEYGGDLDRNPSVGFSRGWYGIRIENLTEESVFDNALLRFGGKWYSGGAGVDSKANLYAINSPILITNSVFEGSAGCGLKLFNSSTTPTILENNICRNNGEFGPDFCGI